MAFKEEFLTALNQGWSHQKLLDLTVAHQPDPRQAYEELEHIWRELGFDAKVGAPGQDELEFVLEKLWYSCPASGTTT
jgi:hypothetical protein